MTRRTYNNGSRNWFHSRNVALLECLIATVTVIASYLIALYEGHVQLWPIPMISFCGVQAPEKYVFSIGLVSAAFLMFLFIWIIETAGKIYSSRFLAYLLGFPAAIGLMVLAVANCEEALNLHYAGALTYFNLFAVWCVSCSFREGGLERGQKDRWVYIRQVLSIVITVLTAAMWILFLVIKDKVANGRIPVCEWGAVILSNVYIATFYFDLGKEYYIEQVHVPDEVRGDEERARTKLRYQYGDE